MQFGFVKPNKSDQTFVDIAKDLKLFYLNQLSTNRYTLEDPVHDTSDIFEKGIFVPRYKFPRHFVQHCWWLHEHWSLPHPNFTWEATQAKYTTYKITLQIWQNRRWLISQHTERQPKQYWPWQLHKTNLKNLHSPCVTNSVDTSTPKTYSRNDPKSPISQAILDLIKEKRRLRRLYNNTQDPTIKHWKK